MTGGERLVVGGDEITITAAGAASGGALLAAEVRMPAGGGPPALHRHAWAEVYRVDEGELVAYVAGTGGRVARIVAGPGACVAIPGGREHTIRNESGAEARAFAVWAPGDGMERFVRAAAALTAAGAPAMEDVLALAAEHGVGVTRPLAEVA